MRVQARAVLAEALRNAHRWLDELIVDPHQTIEAIAAHGQKSERSIRMTLSLAFVCYFLSALRTTFCLPCDGHHCVSRRVL